MLDFLLVLGQVPFTNIQITFYDIVAVLCVAYLYYDYKKYEREIRRWRKWAWRRTCVNYRKQKRHMISVIRYKRYRLVIFKRRIIRDTKTYFRRRRRAVIHNYLKTKRLIRKTIRKTYLFAIDQTYGRYTRFVKAARRAISRRRRLILNAIHRRAFIIFEQFDREIRGILLAVGPSFGQFGGRHCFKFIRVNPQVIY
jgi:hypothetical protein